MFTAAPFIYSSPRKMNPLSPTESPTAELAESHEWKHQEFETWVREVRDPSTYRSEGPRRIVAGGHNGCVLEYELAPLANGYGLSFDFNFPGYSGCTAPWRVYPTRQAAIDSLLAECLKRCEHELAHDGGSMSNANRSAAKVMLGILAPGDLFGFQEPSARPRSEWWDDMIADQLDRMTLWQGFALIDVVRGMKDAPSKTGSFFDIPLPAGVTEKRRYYSADSEEADDDPDDEN